MNGLHCAMEHVALAILQPTGATAKEVVLLTIDQQATQEHLLYHIWGHFLVKSN